MPRRPEASDYYVPRGEDAHPWGYRDAGQWHGDDDTAARERAIRDIQDEIADHSERLGELERLQEE